jgi:hypothetical protein
MQDAKQAGPLPVLLTLVPPAQLAGKPHSCGAKHQRSVRRRFPRFLRGMTMCKVCTRKHMNSFASVSMMAGCAIHVYEQLLIIHIYIYACVRCCVHALHGCLLCVLVFLICILLYSVSFVSLISCVCVCVCVCTL